jgi:hypothetical protein
MLRNFWSYWSLGGEVSNTAVLRFSDYEVSTILEHQKVLQREGAVWWGWWRKHSEDPQLEPLAEVKSAVPNVVGLVNRQSPSYYAARCREVVFLEDGTRVASPQPARTPHYYAEVACSAWFLLEGIEELDQASWENRFGGMPVGEQTFFLVPMFDPVAAKQVLHGTLEEPVRIECPGPGILHLSDLHFGDSFAFPLTEIDAPIRKHSLVPHITRGLQRRGCPQVGLVVISGDLTTMSQAPGFYEAQMFIERLLEALGLSIEHLVIVPGNHDIILDREHPTRTYSADMPFRNMLSALYGRRVANLDRLQWFALPGGPDVFFLALNSVRPPRKPDFKEYGYVGSDYYEPLLEQLNRMREHAQVKGGLRPVSIAVLHHHLLPTGLVEDPEVERPVSLTLDAGQLVEDLLVAQVDVALHGHQHVPFVGSTARVYQAATNSWRVPLAPLWVIGCGSSGASAASLWNEMRNNALGIYSFEGATLRIRMLQYAPGVELSDYMDITLPLVPG